MLKTKARNDSLCTARTSNDLYAVDTSPRYEGNYAMAVPTAYLVKILSSIIHHRTFWPLEFALWVPDTFGEFESVREPRKKKTRAICFFSMLGHPCLEPGSCMSVSAIDGTNKINELNYRLLIIV